MSKKTLILKSDRDDFEQFYIENMQSEKITTVPIYKCRKGLSWKLCVLWVEKFRLPFSEIWYREWKKSLNYYDMIIVFDRNLNWNVVSYIKKHNADARIIAWYWNIITPRNKLPDKYKKYCEEWSFNPSDCRKCGISFNNQFYFPQKAKDNCRISVDFFFIGMDKGRIEKLERLSFFLRELGFSTDFRVVRDKTSKGKKSEFYQENPIPYRETIAYMKRSRCIVELKQDNQDGMTVRALEAAFYQKKLLTDCNIFEKENSMGGNVLYVGQLVSAKQIREFMDKPFVPFDVGNFTFEAWADRFRGNDK